MEQSPPVKIDTLLEPLLAETSDEHADQLLSQLITTHAEPVIRGVIRFKLRLNSYLETQRAEADDIHQEVVLQLLAQLQRFRKLPSGHPISDVRGMAAVIAHRTCARWVRRQVPERHAFKNRLHYLLTRHRDFALWPDTEGTLCAGFVVWQGTKKVGPVRNLAEAVTTLDQPGKARAAAKLKVDAYWVQAARRIQRPLRGYCCRSSALKVMDLQLGDLHSTR